MKNKISERLKGLIDEEKITINKLATELNVAYSVVYNWIHGNSTPNADYIIAICDYFHISSDYLLGITDNY